jgi:short-subunit dehydrogenase
MKKCALITGAAGGLGKAFAAECASRGWDLFLTDLRADLLPPLVAGLGRLYGVEVHSFPCDLTDHISRERLWEKIRGVGRQFHFLINVAGNGDEGPFTDRNPEDLRTLLRLNVEAMVDMTRQVLPFRDPANPFHIINISSLAGFFPMPLKAVYAASKRFVIDFSLALGEELKPMGITTTVLCPAGLPTHQASIQRIVSQGVIGQLTTVNVGNAAALTLDRALAGKSIVIPGFFNRVMQGLGSFLPAQLAVRIVGSRWRKMHQNQS